MLDAEELGDRSLDSGHGRKCARCREGVRGEVNGEMRVRGGEHDFISGAATARGRQP